MQTGSSLVLRRLIGYMDYICRFQKEELDDNSGPSSPRILGARAVSSLTLQKDSSRPWRKQSCPKTGKWLPWPLKQFTQVWKDIEKEILKEKEEVGEGFSPLLSATGIKPLFLTYTCPYKSHPSQTKANILCYYLHGGFWGGSVVKNLPASAGDLGSIPGLGRSPGGGNDNLLRYSCLRNPMDGEAWQATVHRVAKSLTGVSDWTLKETLVICVI